MDNLTKQQRRKNMRNIRSTGTAPERILMRAVRRQGIYFARNAAALPGKPDLAFRRKQVAVFVDSDFWHGRPGRYRIPDTNRSYWKTKIELNRARDRRVNRELKHLGWKVIRFWEYDIRHRPDRVVQKLLTALQDGRTGTIHQ